MDQPRLGRPTGRSLCDLAQQWNVPVDINAVDYYQEQVSAIKSMLPEDFKRWYHSSNIAEAHKEYIKMLGKEAHLTSIIPQATMQRSSRSVVTLSWVGMKLGTWTSSCC
jgi:hypothetical protein